MKPRHYIYRRGQYKMPDLQICWFVVPAFPVTMTIYIYIIKACVLGYYNCLLVLQWLCWEFLVLGSHRTPLTTELIVLVTLYSEASLAFRLMLLVIELWSEWRWWWWWLWWCGLWPWITPWSGSPSSSEPENIVHTYIYEIKMIKRHCISWKHCIFFHDFYGSNKYI